MPRTRLVVTVGFFSCCLAVASAQRLSSARAVIDTYRAAIQRAQEAPSRGQIEVAFNAIGPLREALVASPDGANGSTLESLSQPEFDELRRELVGVVVNREEVVFVEPDVAYFRELAARGDSADRAFFAALSATYPESIWPVYVEQQTDYSGCTRFGSGTLVTIYLAWTAFRHEYPRRYEEASRKRLDDVSRG